jgi:uncharacterized protein YodC (DUF2158 family)
VHESGINNMSTKFKAGDVVRLKGQKFPMTVIWQEIEDDVDTVGCRYFDDEKKEIFLPTPSESVELIPDKILKKIKNESDKSDLKSIINSHPVIIFSSIAIISFCAGFASSRIIISTANQKVLPEGSYITLEEHNKTIDKYQMDIKRLKEALIKKNSIKTKS